MFATTKAKLAFFCYVAVLFSNTQALDKKDGRIVNGRVIDISQTPYAVQIRSWNGVHCGGALITPMHIVTAAHCVENGVDYLIAVGSANTFYDEGIQRRIVSYTIPTGYDMTTGMDMDIAVLKLDAPMVGGVVKTIPLCTKPWTSGRKIQVSGWGTLAEGGQMSLNLRTIFLTMITHEQCVSRNLLESYNNSAKECAFTPGQDSCQGDSGGPGVYDGELCGVVSAGRGCADPKYPGIYTSVYTMRDFIQRAVKTL